MGCPARLNTSIELNPVSMGKQGTFSFLSIPKNNEKGGQLDQKSRRKLLQNALNDHFFPNKTNFRSNDLWNKMCDRDKLICSAKKRGSIIILSVFTH